MPGAFQSSAFQNSGYQTDLENTGPASGRGGKRDETTYDDWRALVEYRDALRQIKAEAEKPKPVKAAVKAAVERLNVVAAEVEEFDAQPLKPGTAPKVLLRQIDRIEAELVRQIEVAQAQHRAYLAEMDDEEAVLALFM